MVRFSSRLARGGRGMGEESGVVGEEEEEDEEADMLLPVKDLFREKVGDG